MTALPVAPPEDALDTTLAHPTYAHLTTSDVEILGRELDAVRDRHLARRGEEDLRYITRILRMQQAFEVGGRLAFVGVFWTLWAWPVAVLLLAGAKILDNMELGHNIMHGQYDFTNDPRFDSGTYEWDHAAAAPGWRRTHNYLHHTFTNVLGMDRDIGYGTLRVTSEQYHRTKHWFQPVSALFMALFFDLAIALHGVETDRGRRDSSRFGEVMEDMGTVALTKVRRQALKDFVVFPLLLFPIFVPVLLGNVVANMLRNVWTFAVIFCGHFPDGVGVFDAEVVENETRAEWYLRQMLGSANIEGGRLFDIWTGNLNHQIEHHLFPDMPSHRLRDVAVEVRALCAAYELPYTTGRFSKQFGNVVWRILKFTLPNPALRRLGVSLA